MDEAALSTLDLPVQSEHPFFKVSYQPSLKG